MPSTATLRNRFEKQATGENTNTWGSKLNATLIDLLDAALDGRTTFSLSGSKTLSSTNFAADESRARFLDVTGGTGGAVTIPAVEKLYFVRNGSSGSVTITAGGSTSATLAAGMIQWVVCDGTNVRADTSASAAAASAAAAAASAASITDANLVHLTGTETIGGAKTFSNAITASGGITINGQTLASLSSTGKSIAESANVSAALSALGVSAFMKTLLDDADAAAARATLGTNIAAVLGGNNTALTTTTPTTLNVPFVTGTMPTGSTYRITVRGTYAATSVATGLGLALVCTGTVNPIGTWRAWTSATAFTEGQISSPSETKSFPNVSAISTLYVFEAQFFVTQITTGTLEIKAFNTAGTGNVTITVVSTMVVERVA